MFNFLYKKTKILDLNSIQGLNDTLIAGPYLGEFGWELMQWQGYLRFLSKFYKKIIIYGRRTSSFIYKDFATEFHPIENKSWNNDAYELKGFDYEKWAKGFESADILVADNRCKYLQGILNQEFISFGKKNQNKSFDIVIHARNIPLFDKSKEKYQRNWPLANWDLLCDSLSNLKIAAVGLKELSYSPKNAEDLRGIDTEEICDVLRNSRLCVGPSSGLMHLASLCQTPHLVWISEKSIKRFGGLKFRYLRGWNPFGTKVQIVEKYGTNPPINIIQKNIMSFLNEQ